MMVHIRPSLPGDCWLILNDLRPEEEIELAALGVTSEHCIRFGLLYGNAYTGFINGEPAGIFGIAEYGDVKVPWGVFTRAIDRHPIAFLRASRAWFSQVRAGTEQVVDVRNVLAVKWFRWMGFEVSEPEVYGSNGELFARVTVH
jgi:hypothetical protein